MVKLTRLKLVRQRKALTQQQLADKARVNRVTIARLEGGKDEPFPTTVRKVAAALGVEPEDLMGLPLGPAATDAPLDDRLAVIDEQGVRRLLRAEPELAVVVREAADQLVKFIPDARLSLELLTDPDYGEGEQLFLGVSTSLQDGEALEALRRFDREWWTLHVRRAHGLLCIDFRDE